MRVNKMSLFKKFCQCAVIGWVWGCGGTGWADFSTLVTNGSKLGYATPLPDFSYTGYALSGQAIPTQYPVKKVLTPSGGDDTAAIQEAINAVAALATNSSGIRGAIYLQRGVYNVSSPLTITASGVILKGDGAGGEGTIIRHTGADKSESTIVVGTFTLPGAALETTITDTFLGSGSKVITVSNSANLSVGQEIQIRRPVVAAWVEAVGLTEYWDAADFTLKWIRTITAKSGNQITLNAPITSSIDSLYGAGQICRITSDPRISNVGIEDILFISDYDLTVMADGYYNDENHAQNAILLQAVKDCWVRRVTGFYYWFSLVSVKRVGARVTVEDCAMFDGVSLDTPVHHQGTREYFFDMEGSETLVQRCFARNARHAFISNGIAATTNVYLDCYSSFGHLTNEPHQRWSSAVIYDNLYSETMISLAAEYSDHGQKCVNSMAWNCEINNRRYWEPNLQISKPMNGAENNWAVGNVLLNTQGYENPPVTSPVVSLAAYVESMNAHVEPRSLTLAQLNDRGTDLPKNITTETQLNGGQYDNLEANYLAVPSFQDPDNLTWLAGWMPQYEAKISGVQSYRYDSSVIALWHLDEVDAAAARADAAPANHPLTQVGTASIPIVDGLFGNGVGTFNVGDNNYFATTGMTLPNPATQTFECWVLFPTSATLPQDGGQQMIMTRRGSRFPISFYFQGTSGSAYLGLEVRNAAGTANVLQHNFGTTLQRDKWYHVAYTLEQSGTDLKVSLFLQDKDSGVRNPAAIESATYANFTYDTALYDLRLGEDGNTGVRAFTGVIDEVRYRNVASSVFETFGRVNPVACTSTDSTWLALWHLDGMSGSVYPDSSANARNLTENATQSGTLQSVTGVFGTAVTGFKTVDNHSLSVSSMPNPSVQSLEAWVMFDDNALLPQSAGRTQHLFARPSGTDRLNFFFSTSGSDALLSLKVTNASNVRSTISYNLGATVKKNVWYRVAYSLEQVGSDLNVKLYFNEKGMESCVPVLCKTLTGFTYNTTAGSAVIGEDNHTGNTTFTGAIDEVRYRQTAGF